MSDKPALGNPFCLKCGGLRVDGKYHHKEHCYWYGKEPTVIKNPPKQGGMMPKEKEEDNSN